MADRFKKTYSQYGEQPQKPGADWTEIWVDTNTGVNYLFHSSGPAGGLTVLVDKDGKPIVTK